jgi:hypothetical protein
MLMIENPKSNGNQHGNIEELNVAQASAVSGGASAFLAGDITKSTNGKVSLASFKPSSAVNNLAAAGTVGTILCDIDTTQGGIFC